VGCGRIPRNREVSLRERYERRATTMQCPVCQIILVTEDAREINTHIVRRQG
jgi:hypothetical protein